MKFPAEKEGVKKFYDECWKVFNALNSLGENGSCFVVFPAAACWISLPAFTAHESAHDHELSSRD